MDLDVDAQKVLCYYHLMMKEKSDCFKRTLKYEGLVDGMMDDLKLNAYKKVMSMSKEQMDEIVKEINNDMLELF